ncbi:MAG TPA: hypothetical protein VLA72_02435 [Anaerolineales bacterium]|nr:hypothetical protein [Anaerolineales bacterium]
MKFTTAPLVPDMYYHIYNRGNNRENLFLEERNYSYSMSLYEKDIEPIADTYAYCLMRNHFHLLVRSKSEEEYLQQTSRVLETREVLKPKKFNPSQDFGNLFNAYAKAIKIKDMNEQAVSLKNDLEEHQLPMMRILQP